MLCRNPYTSGAAAYPCGQCMPCRFNRRRIWSHRILLESLQYADNTFCTLTYSDENLPPDGSLDPRHAQLWLKRLRFTYGEKIRFYLVGEYGDTTLRPHYHAALFGFPNCRRGTSYFPRPGSRCCAVCDIVASTWQHGNILLAPLNEQTASYVAGYVTKKMTSKDDSRLNGRHPEFARMSLRPGIGHDALHEVASELIRYDLASPDVPLALRHGSKQLPLGRYLRRKLRLLVGLDENAPQEVIDKMAEELSPMYEAAFSTPRNAGRKNFFREALIDMDNGRVAQMEARNRIYKERRVL